MSLRPAWLTEWVQDQPEQHSETLSQKRNEIFKWELDVARHVNRHYDTHHCGFALSCGSFHWANVKFLQIHIEWPTELRLPCWKGKSSHWPNPSFRCGSVLTFLKNLSECKYTKNPDMDCNWIHWSSNLMIFETSAVKENYLNTM